MIEQLAEKVIARMSAEERRDLVLAVVDKMLEQMSADERRQVMEHVVGNFLVGLSDEDRRQTARELVPQLLGELLRSGGMSVDDLLWAAMGSLGALDKEHAGAEGGSGEGQSGEKKA